MAGKIAFELVSPERLLVSREVDMAVVPGAEGDFGVLPGHAPLLSPVRPGAIEIHDEGAPVERIFVAGGFAEAAPDRCTVLATEAFPLSGVTRADAEARLAAAPDDPARAAAAAALVEALDHYGEG